MKFSADQHLAMAQHLRRRGNALPHDDPRRAQMRARAWSFLALAKLARAENWPSSAVAPHYVLTPEESASMWADRGTRQRVFAPFLTAMQIEALRRSSKEHQEYARELFAEYRRGGAGVDQ